MAFSKSKFKTAFLNKPICHRALHDKTRGIWENSREAVDEALAAGLPIEVDLQMTHDARAVVFHDRKLDRLTDASGRVSQLSAEDMTKIPLKDGNHTLTFAELLERVAGRVPILVEIKDQDGALGPNIGGFVDEIIALSGAYEGAIALMSFNPYVVQALREKLKNVPIGLTSDAAKVTDWPKVPKARRQALREFAEIPGLEFDFVSHDRSDLERIQTLEVPILCWTVKSAEQEKQARLIADNITFENYRPAGI